MSALDDYNYRDLTPFVARDRNRLRRPPMIEEIEWFDQVQPALTSAYVIKGVLDQGALSVLFGPSNSGKTFFALDLAFHTASTTMWRDRRVDPGSVLYLAAEGGNGIANRIVALRQQYGIADVPLALRRAGLDLLDPTADVQRVIDLAGEIAGRAPLRMIVVDTLSRAIAGGDENGPVDMTAFVRNVDAIRHATGAHIIVVHHTGKDAARGARGHTSLLGAIDTEIEIAVDEEGNRAATVSKQRDHPGGETFGFTLEKVDLGLDQDGELVTSCVVAIAETITAYNGTPSLTTSRNILKLIDEGWSSKNPLTTAPQSKKTARYAPRFLSQHFAMRQADIEKLIGSWLDNEIVVMDVVDTNTKKRGLRVQQWI